MTKLAAYNEALGAEALAFVDDWIADPREPNFFRPDAEEKYGKSMMKHWMQLYPSFGPDEIVYLAANGNQQAVLALREMWGEYEQRGVGRHLYHSGNQSCPPAQKARSW